MLNVLVVYLERLLRGLKGGDAVLEHGFDEENVESGLATDRVTPTTTDSVRSENTEEVGELNFLKPCREEKLPRVDEQKKKKEKRRKVSLLVLKGSFRERGGSHRTHARDRGAKVCLRSTNLFPIGL